MAVFLRRCSIEHEKLCVCVCVCGVQVDNWVNICLEKSIHYANKCKKSSYDSSVLGISQWMWTCNTSDKVCSPCWTLFISMSVDLCDWKTLGPCHIYYSILKSTVFFPNTRKEATRRLMMRGNREAMLSKEVTSKEVGEWSRARWFSRSWVVKTGRRGTCGSAESVGPWENVYKVVVPGTWWGVSGTLETDTVTMNCLERQL